MNKRFSRVKVAITIWKAAEAARGEHKFSESNGWDQVNGGGEETNRAYGAWRALMDLLTDIDEDGRALEEALAAEQEEKD